MKKLTFLIAILIVATRLSRADSGCYWVFFTDKSDTNFNPYEYFDTKAIERREKLGLPLSDSTDFPLNTSYVDIVAQLAEDVVGMSRWFNAIGVMADNTVIDQISALPFVKDVVEIAGAMEVASYANATDDAETDEQQLASDIRLMPQLQRMQGQKFADNNLKAIVSNYFE